MVVAVKERFQAHLVFIEAKGSGLMAWEELFVNQDYRWSFRITPEGHKTSCAERQTPVFEAGQVYMPLNEPTFEPYFDELLNFPYAKNDDWVDSTSQLLSSYPLLVPPGVNASCLRRYK